MSMSKEKTNFDSNMLLFDLRKIISSRSRPSFETLFARLENSHSVTRNA
jgi:hypothetical protein